VGTERKEESKGKETEERNKQRKEKTVKIKTIKNIFFILCFYFV